MLHRGHDREVLTRAFTEALLRDGAISGANILTATVLVRLIGILQTPMCAQELKLRTNNDTMFVDSDGHLKTTRNQQSRSSQPRVW